MPTPKPPEVVENTEEPKKDGKKKDE